MDDSVTRTEAPAPRLSELFSRAHRGASVMLAGGVALYAVETYVTITITPSIVRDVGGLDLIAWLTTLYVALAVIGSVFVAMRPEGMSLRSVYVLGALLFAAGNLVDGLAPSMAVVLAGRALQGLGTGMLSALAYAFIRHVYPEPLRPRATALYAAIWGLATLIGPSLGGLFAEGSLWRWAFLAMVPLALLMALFAPRILPAVDDDREASGLPLVQIGCLVFSVMLASLAGSAPDTGMRMIFFLASFAAVVAMFLAERRLPARLLPAGAIAPGDPLARTYLIMIGLLIVLSADVYLPWFLQELHGVSPIMSGFMSALVAMGWTAGAFFTDRLTGRSARRIIVIGVALEALTTASLALLLARHNPQGALVVLVPAAFAMFGMGLGVGLGWAHLVTLVQRLAPPQEQDKASAAISTLQSLGAGFGAALAGIIANSSGLVTPGGIAGTISAAFWLCLLIGLPGLLMVPVARSLPALDSRETQG